MFNMAICDDDPFVLEEMERLMEIYLEDTHAEMSWETFTSGEDLWQAVKYQQYDLIFLDIEMPGMNGIEFGKKLRNEMEEKWTQIVFVTAKEAYAREGYKVHPKDFIMKPIKEEEIMEVLNELVEQNDVPEEYFSYQIDSIVYRRPYRDILYVCSEGRKNCVITRTIQQCYRGALRDIEDDLSAHGFVRIHGSYMVNLRYVRANSRTKILMPNGDTLPISEAHQKSFTEALLNRARTRKE